jgi:hypothetical protein
LTNTLAYYDSQFIATAKMFYGSGPRSSCYTLFTTVIYDFKVLTENASALLSNSKLVLEF